MGRLLLTVPLIAIFTLFLRATPAPMSEEYHLINQFLTWTEAQSYCRLKFSDLAAVNNMQQQGRLFDLVESRAPHAWIGLRKGPTRRWMWSDGRGPAQFTPWSANEPDNIDGNDWCVEMMDDGMWNDISCANPNGFVCYEHGEEEGQLNFIRYSSLTDWRTGQETCRKKHIDLAPVRNSKINSVIHTLVSPGTQVWIGLFNDAWAWSDGRDSSFRLWVRDGEEYGDCAVISTKQDGFWTGAACEETAAFVCEGGLKTKKTLIKIKVSSDVDLNNSVFTEAVIIKLWTIFMNHNVADFKLLWKRGKDGQVFHRQNVIGSKEETCGPLLSING